MSHFHAKNRGMQGLVSVKITFQKCTTNSYFENGGVGIKTTVTNW